MDGTFLDDVQGLPREQAKAPGAMCLSDDEVADIKAWSHNTTQRVIEELVAVGKYVRRVDSPWTGRGAAAACDVDIPWRDTSRRRRGRDVGIPWRRVATTPRRRRGHSVETNARLRYAWQAFGAYNDVGPAPTNDTADCIATMRGLCPPNDRPMTMKMGGDASSDRQAVAAFLVTRPRAAWLGFGWESDEKDWNPLFDLDVGEPLENCNETEPGVFRRAWSNGVAALDCNAWEAELDFT